jgi:enoyl-CoA hydratase/3-hydroxyacyl-CoA dehydrogenase
MSHHYETLKIEREQSIVWITINRPHRLNALNAVLMDELSEVLDTIDKDASVRCVTIIGEGDRAFSSGADLIAFTKVTPILAAEFSRTGQRLFSKVESLSKPVVAAINGYALGGGLELALACDFRIASEHAELGHPEVIRGIIPGWGGTQRLVRIVGLPKTKKLVLIGDRVKADEALEMGLVDKVVPFEKLRDEARALAQRLCEGAPIALKYAKHAINFGTQVPLEAGLRIEAGLMALLFSTEDVKEGVEAFMSRRKPEFKGQ